MTERQAYKRVVLLACLLLVTVATAATATAAAERSYLVESFHAHLQVEPSGDLVVEERLSFRFDGKFNGIYRDLPVKYRTSLGLDYNLRVTPLSVTDAEGRPLEHETSRQGDDYRFKVWIPGAQDASRSVVLRYRVQRALRFPRAQEGFPDHDELYWNVTGPRWSVPILQATAIVELPEAITGDPWARGFVGRFGSDDRRVVIERPSRNRVRFDAGRELAPGDNLSVVVGWPPGAVYRPTPADRVRELLLANWPLALPLVALAVMILVYRRWGQDPEVGRSVLVEYGPPDDYRPAELGTVIDERVDLRDIVATVIDLGVRGFLRIEETQEKSWIGTSTKTTFVRLQAPGPDLRGYEREILEGLFESGERVTMDALETKFYARMGPIREQLYEGLTSSGLFRSRPDRARRGWFVLAVLALMATAAVGALAQKPAFLFAAPFVGIAIGAFAPFMPARTRRGRQLYLRIKGFEEFLGRTEAERLEKLALEETTFEQFLPYAMAFGVADHWARMFEGIASAPPTWYSGPGTGFNPLLLQQRISGMGTSLGTAMTSAPRSSSGSSGFSSGGGFSGGGFGGGGGGAF